MLRRHFLALLPAPLIRRFGLGPVAALADPIEPADAAKLYARAFDWSRGLTADERSLLHESGASAAADPRLDRLLDRARPVLADLRAAARAATCRWEPARTAEDLTTGRHGVVNGQDVMQAAGLAARRHAEAGRGRAALDDLFAALTMAHRVGSGGVLFARVLECSYEVGAFRTLGRVLPALDRAALDDLAGRLDRLAGPEPASATIGAESRFILDSIRARAATLGPTIGDDQWLELWYGGDEASALRRITGGDRARLLAHLDATGPAFAELARRLDLPRPGCRAEVEAFGREAMETFPIAASLADAAWGIRHVVDRMTATRALVRAGLALVRDGEAAFRAVLDPLGAGPFDLERRGRGHLIRSALRDEGRPEVALQVGEPS